KTVRLVLHIGHESVAPIWGPSDVRLVLIRLRRSPSECRSRRGGESDRAKVPRTETERPQELFEGLRPAGVQTHFRRWCQTTDCRSNSDCWRTRRPDAGAS